LSYHDKIELGRTGVKVSRIGIGSSYGVDATALEEAFERGINLFYFGTRRTAAMAEAIQHLASQHRSEIAIVVQSYTRVSWFLARSVEVALRKLKQEYADFLILGKLDRVPSPGLIEEAVRLKESGKIRFLIVSAHRRAVFADHLRSGIFDVIMTRYNASHVGAERDVFALLPPVNRPGVICYTATRWGTLLQPVPGEAPVSASDCYRFVLRNPNVDVCLSGPKNRQELLEAIQVLDSEPMPDEDIARMRRIGAVVYKKRAHNYLLRKLIFD
jgi:aryl-alcohol dehydrogenase-like predicted oxidoreductase